MADINALFETNALKICKPTNPFWYTSGLIGVFYVNTHFLCGGEKIAPEILTFIDENQEDVTTFPTKIVSKLESVYETHSVFKNIIDSSSQIIKKQVSENKITHISGGQRRDWFFAPLIAKMLNIDCLYIYNDKKIFDSLGTELSDLNGARVLNIADLLTVGSSYTAKWAPAIKERGGELVAAFNVVDRNQGGPDNLKGVGLTSLESLYSVDGELFQTALNNNYITQEQVSFVSNYLSNPEDSMRNFLISHPEFLEGALNSSDEKTKARAQKLVDGKLYGELG